MTSPKLTGLDGATAPMGGSQWRRGETRSRPLQGTGWQGYHTAINSENRIWVRFSLRSHATFTCRRLCPLGDSSCQSVLYTCDGCRDIWAAFVTSLFLAPGPGSWPGRSSCLIICRACHGRCHPGASSVAGSLLAERDVTNRVCFKRCGRRARLTFANVPPRRGLGSARMVLYGRALRLCIYSPLGDLSVLVDKVLLMTRPFRAPVRLAVFSRERHLSFYSRKNVHRRKPAQLDRPNISGSYIRINLCASIAWCLALSCAPCEVTPRSPTRQQAQI